MCSLVVVLTLQLWAIPLLIALMWYFGSAETPWIWLAAIVESCWGAQWVLIGTYLLGTYPEDRAIIAVLWIGYAVIVAAIGMVNRYRYERDYGI